MKLPQIKKFRWNYLALSFFVPFIGMLIILLVTSCSPFGTNSLMSSDAWHQYYPFFKAFRQAILRGENLLYTWTGLGLDYLGLIAYYLASPLNLLSIFVPESLLLGFFNLLFPLKLSLAGLFFAIFLKKLFEKDDLSLPLFSGFYATCAWAIGYQWNIMWLDTFALLPLVALGTVQLLRGKKFVLYTVSLFFAVFINYYIGFFVCIFVLLTFICYQICRFTTVRRLLGDFVRIGFFTVLALGMTTVITIPALAALQTTHSSVNEFPKSFALNMVSGDAVQKAKTAWSAYKSAAEAGQGNTLGLWWEAFTSSIPPILEGMKKVAGNIGGGIVPTYKDQSGLPNLHCGVGSLIFGFLFLTAKDVKLRDKICSVVLLLFIMVSFLIRQLDYIWHGFHFTNDIPYRFSFLFSFILLYMAYRAFLQREQFKLWQLITAGVLTIGILLCYKDLTDPVYLTYNIVFFLLYAVALVFTWLESRPLPQPQGKKVEVMQATRQRQAASYILAGVLFLELILNLVNGSYKYPRAGIGNYPNGTDKLNNVVQYMQEQDDDLFYRAEVTHSQTLNDSSLIGYNGISVFTSSANVKVTEFMRLMGFSAKNSWNRHTYEESSPVANLFLNLKYMIERNGNVDENAFFDHIYGYGNVHLLRNNAYLPLGFLAESSLADLKFASASSAFDFQNKLFTAATGLSGNVWSLTPASALEIIPNATNLTSQSTSGTCAYKNESSQTYLDYTYTVPQDGFLCLDLTASARNKYSVQKNGTELFTEEMGALPQTMAVGQVNAGDTIQLQFRCKANESGRITVRAGILNEALFRTGYNILAASTLELTHFSTTKVEGTIHCNRDGLLYTSIPQNADNWSITVDGKQADVTLVGDTMLAVSLTQGDHEIRFTYRNEAFSLGLCISLVCLFVFAGIVFKVYFYPQIKRKGKYQKDT